MKASYVIIIYVAISLGLLLPIFPLSDRAGVRIFLLSGNMGSLRLFVDAGRSAFDENLIYGHRETLAFSAGALGSWMLGASLLFFGMAKSWRIEWVVVGLVWVAAAFYNGLWYALRDVS